MNYMIEILLTIYKKMQNGYISKILQFEKNYLLYDLNYFL